MSDPEYISIDSISTHGDGCMTRDPSSIAWDVHQAVETLRALDSDNVPAVRRALRSLDRATTELVTVYHHHQDNIHCPVVDFPDYLSVDLQNIMARPYFPDEQAQLMLADVLTRLAPFIYLSPGHVEILLSLLLSWSPCTELQLVWLQLLVHCSQDAWEILSGSPQSTMLQSQQHPQIINPSPWFERLFLLLQRSLNDFPVSQWSLKDAKSTEYSVSVMWRSCISLVLNVVAHLYQSQQASMTAADAVGTAADAHQTTSMLQWMQLSLIRHLQTNAPEYPAHPTAAQHHNVHARCCRLLDMTGKFAQQMVEYAMDALDGALIVVAQQQEDENDCIVDSVSQLQWAMQDAMHHVESALFVLQVTSDWNVVANVAPLLDAIWKQCSQAFVGTDNDGIVAPVLLQVAMQFLKVMDNMPQQDKGSISVDKPTFIMTLFRAVESCPASLLEASLVWNVIAAELQETKTNQDLKSAIQVILVSLSNELRGDGTDDKDMLALGDKFLKLMNGVRHVSEGKAHDWDAYFLGRFGN